VTPRGELEAHAQPAVDVVTGERGILQRGAEIIVAAELRQVYARAVHRDFELMRKLEPGDVSHNVTQELDAELVVRVQGEVVPDEHPSTCTERQPFDVIVMEMAEKDADVRISGTAHQITSQFDDAGTGVEHQGLRPCGHLDARRVPADASRRRPRRRVAAAHTPEADL